MSSADLYYEQAGNGPHVTVIHGVGSRSDDWALACRELTGRFRVLRCDLRGHGRSPSPDGAWTINDFTADIAALLDRLRIQRTHLAGFSLGGLIAQRFALDYSERVNRLSLICATTGRTPEQKANALERMHKLQTLPVDEYVEQSITRWFTPEFVREQPALVEGKRALIRSLNRDAYVRAYRVLVDTNHADELHRIHHPTLIIAAENDIGSPPAMSEKMHQLIPDAKLVVIPRLRHSLLLEAPALVGGLLREFFTTQQLESVEE